MLKLTEERVSKRESGQQYQRLEGMGRGWKSRRIMTEKSLLDLMIKKARISERVMGGRSQIIMKV